MEEETMLDAIISHLRHYDLSDYIPFFTNLSQETKDLYMCNIIYVGLHVQYNMCGTPHVMEYVWDSDTQK